MPELTMQELRDLLTDPAARTLGTSPRREIVVADRGGVFVGFATVAPNGDVSLDDAATVRIWGTSRGLGQLALEGMQPNTKLDPCGSGTVPSSAVVARLLGAEGKWR